MTWRCGLVILEIAVAVLALGGCAAFDQADSLALVRRPGNRMYDDPQSASVSAKDLWQYAVLSENMYAPKAEGRTAEVGEKTVEASQYVRACFPQPRVRFPLDGWKPWENFPPKDLHMKGLYFEVWETTTRPAVIAVAFRGTEAADPEDWKANFRWFLRFVPFYTDEYVEVSRSLGRALIDRLKTRLAEGTLDRNVRLVATGHSLGGGLAQHLAYSLPTDGSGDRTLPRITKVYAFDPSPVTGWSTVPRDLREGNARGLETARAFEHGEILAYVRLILSYVNPPSKTNPAITEIRYNFIKSNPLRSHSMRMMACALINASETASIPDVAQRFGHD